MKIRIVLALICVGLVLLLGCEGTNSTDCTEKQTPLISLGGIWSTRSSGTSVSLVDVAWIGSRFVAVGYMDTALVSTDGALWEPIPLSANLNALAWSGDKRCVANNLPRILVGVGEAGKILTSPDGLVWTERLSGTSQPIHALGWTGRFFVAVGSGGVILLSQDGMTWSIKNSGTTGALRDLAWNDSILVVAGDVIISSTDGETWVKRDTPGSDGKGLTWVSRTEGSFVANNPGAIPSGGGYTLNSSDGITWTKYLGASNRTKPIQLGTQQAAFNTPTDVATQAVIHVWFPGDTLYPSQALGSIFTPRKVSWNGSRLVVVGEGGTIVTLP